jgi:regulator of cell morphogenesis and NO signaling
MESTALKYKRIAELVGENYVRAYVLFYFGIRFDEYSEFTLEEACLKKGLNIEQVVRELENHAYVQEDDLPLISYPIDLIIEYLKHTHFLFIKHKLPYIARLIEAFTAEHPMYKIVERDLRTVFPLFVEDFIHHIYEEEDTLFKYIKALDRASKGSYLPTRLYYLIEKHSVHKFSMEHEAHDDEMAGIRKITRDYHITDDAPLHVKVLYSELKAFEKSLLTHARIENEILFPKAMALESKVKMTFYERSRLN